MEIVVLVGQQRREELRDVAPTRDDKLNQLSSSGSVGSDVAAAAKVDESCQPAELEQTSKSQEVSVESLAKQALQPADSNNNSGSMIDNISERLSRLQTRGNDQSSSSSSSAVAKDSPKRKSMVSIRLLKQQAHSQESEVVGAVTTETAGKRGNTMSNSESEEYKLLMRELKKRQVNTGGKDDVGKQQVTDAPTTAIKAPEVIEEDQEDDEEEQEEKANGLSSLARTTKLSPTAGAAATTNGRFSMLRQSFSHKTISSMLKYGRASMRIKQPAAAATANSGALAITSGGQAAEETASESSKLLELTARDAEKKAKALAVAEANLLAARQLKQQAEKLKKQQKRELQQLESASYMLMATQYNQQIQRQLQLQQQQQQQQLLYQQAQQYAAVASSGQMFDASGVHQLQQQFLLQQQRQQQHQQQQQQQHQQHQQQQQQQQMAYYMAAQQMAASVIQPSSSAAMLSLMTAGLAAPQPAPAALMYQHPATAAAALTYKQQESISGLMKAPMSVSEAIYASAQQHRHHHQHHHHHQQQQQQTAMVPMSVNHHSSFDIVYGPPSSNHHHHHQSDMYHAAQLVDQSHIPIHPSKQQQYHHRQQLPHQQQQQQQQRQLPQSKLPKPAARSSLGASMRKTVKSILNHRSSVLNNQTNSKDTGTGSTNEQRKAPEPAPRQTVAAVANGERKLKSVLKTSSANNNNSIAARNLVVLNSEGSDGDGSSSDSTLTNSDSNKSSSNNQIMPKSVLKKSSSSSSSTSSSTSSCSVSAASSSDSSLSSCHRSGSHSPEPARDFSGRRASDESTTDSVASCGTIVAGTGGTLKRNIACRQSVKVLSSSDQERIAAIRASKRRSVAMGTTGRKNVTFSAKLISIV